jgi:hypothetical protein
MRAMPSLAFRAISPAIRHPCGSSRLVGLVVLAAAAAAVSASAGCAASSQAMTRAGSRPLDTPAPDRATVIFLRTSAFGASESFELFDDKKRFLGESLPRTHFEVSLPPGVHWFYASAENTAVMRAELEAGKRYFVNVQPYIGAWGARVELLSLARSPREWRMRSRLLQQTERMIAVKGTGQAELNARAGELDEEIEAAGHTWRSASQAWQTAHNLLAEDGEPIPRAQIDPAPPAAETPAALGVPSPP